MKTVTTCLLLIFCFLFFFVTPTSSAQTRNFSANYIDFAAIDSSIHPGDDFYRFANGTWFKNTALPETGYRMTMTDLMEANEKSFDAMLKSITENNPPAGTAEKQLYRFYTSGMDQMNSPKNGLATMKRHCQAIDRIGSIAELQQYLAGLLSVPSYPLIALRPNDSDESVANVQAYLIQAGLPVAHTWYQIPDTASKGKFQKYENLLAESFVRMGYERKNAALVIDLERKIAALHETVSKPEKKNIRDLVKESPRLPWLAIAKRYGIAADFPLEVRHPNYYRGLSRLLTAQLLNAWKQKLKADYILYNLQWLSAETAQHYHNLFEIEIKGTETPFSREVQIRDLMTNFYSWYNIVDVSGLVFAKQVLPATDRNAIYQMAEAIRKAFKKRLSANAWLAPQTRQQALQKLDAMVFKIGYSDHSPALTLPFDEHNFVYNFQVLYQQKQQEILQIIGKPKNRKEWKRNLWSIAGSYQPEINAFEIVAGLLQKPFYQAGADDAVNYGALGSIIAHEISHGFDNLGKDYNWQGVKKNWWLPQDTLAFGSLVAPLISQFSNYTVMDTVNIDGVKTLGENIADLTGLQVAYEAFQQTRQYKENKKINGLFPTQRFILAFAQQWKSKYTDAILKEYFLTDVHPPDNIRVNGVLSNFEPFYESFQVKSGNKLYKERKIVVW